MTPERWQQINELYHDALELDANRQATFLNQACSGDAGLRDEVQSLIASHDQAGSFIAEPALKVAARVLAEDQATSLMGRMFSHYRIESLLGVGGMGEVYLAEDTSLDRKVALKLLPAQFTNDSERLRRFRQEAHAASALNHPNILTIYEIGQVDGHHYTATEFIDGETLREHMASTRMKLDELLDVAGQVASALAAAHAAAIVHRDIKPENVMVRSDGFVKVLDFGLAKLATRHASLSEPEAPTKSMVKTNPGMVIGTVQYMSPEQAHGQEVDSRSDIWSLGVVLYEMITGHVAFAGETPSHVIVSILESEPPPLSLGVEVPAELERIISKALRKERAERYQTADDMALDLKNLKEELTVESRLKQFRRSDADGRDTSTKSDGRAALKTAHASVTSTADVGIARLKSSAEYLVNGIRRHKGGAVFASMTAFLLVASLAFFSDFTKGGSEAIDSVAVLPFVNAGGDPEAEYLSDGISDSVINSLSRLPNLRVISLNTVLRYKGKQIDPQAVGRELNVRAVLMSRMTQRGDELAISTELVDVRDNRRLWGEQYSRKMSDLLVVENEIAREISERLRLRLSGEEKKQLAKQYTKNPEAYQLYSVGNYYFRKQTKEAFERSVESYEQAIKIDPDYALAYLGLSRAYGFMGSRGFWPTKESKQKSEWAALKALQLDDTLAEAHAVLGVKKYNSFDWAGAERELKRALELDPNSEIANRTYFYYLAAIGRTDEALHYAIRAKELDPSSGGPGGLGFAYLLARQYDKAIELYREGLEKEPDNAHSHILLGEAYVAKGMPAEGVAEMQKGVALDVELAKTPERWDRYPMLAYAYAAAGRRGEALKILEDQKRLARQRYVSPYNFAIIYTGLGDKDQAFAWLEKCIEQRTGLVYRLKVRPMFDPLRSDPRFAELLRRINLEP